MEKLGRARDHLKILPGVLVVVGDTAAEAQAKRTLLDSLVHPDSGVASLSAHWATTCRTAISMVPCQRSPKAMPAGAGGNGWWTARNAKT